MKFQSRDRGIAMGKKLLLVFPIILMLSTISCSSDTDSVKSIKFPENFAWGTATSAYQIEGAYDEDGNGVSVWDVYTTSIMLRMEKPGISPSLFFWL